MCNAFSCLIHKNKTVTWKFGVDSHEDLIRIANYVDDKYDPDFARVEISPTDGDYLNPDSKYVFKLDEGRQPSWWSVSYENKCWDEQEKWLSKLNKILIRKKIVHPFKISPPEITDEHIKLLKEWYSVGGLACCSVADSVFYSVGESVSDSVGDLIFESVGESIVNAVGESVRGSGCLSIWSAIKAYYGSFFSLPRESWKYTSDIKTDEYPFISLVKLWELGLVPSFFDKVCRLHGGKDAKVLFEITKEELNV